MAQGIRILVKKLRLGDPWRYKAPFLMSVPYLLIGIRDMDAVPAIPGVLASFSTIFGFAGFGYFVNDLKDMAEDRLAGKPNAVSDMGSRQRIWTVLAVLALAILPWFYLPLNAFTLPFFLLEFFLFWAYSAPPLRLKERGAWGVAADALYAHANPALLAALTFHFLGRDTLPDLEGFIFSLVIWQLLVGIRNIFFHQIKDHEKDKQTGTETLVTRLGVEKANRLVRWWVLPLEVLALAWFSMEVGRHFFAFPLTWGLFLLLMLLRVRVLWKGRFPQGFRERVNLLLDDYYNDWIPVFVLLWLASMHIWAILLLGLHLAVFPSGPGKMVKEWRKR